MAEIKHAQTPNVSDVIKTAVAHSQQGYLGRHIIAEFFQADFDALNKSKELAEAMQAAAKAAGATVLSSHDHFFEPHGVSCVVIIQESNLCIHTWPEFGYAAVDLFTCAAPETAAAPAAPPDVDAALRSLIGSLHATNSSRRHVRRGMGKL